MSIIDDFRWWRSFHRNKTLRAWIEETYSVEEIRRMVIESTDCNLHAKWDFYHPLENPLELPFEQWWDEKAKWGRAVKRLYRRYGDEIWSICLPERQIGVDKLAPLDLAGQISEPKLFEEFMVRNALKLTAIRILKDKGVPSNSEENKEQATPV